MNRHNGSNVTCFTLYLAEVSISDPNVGFCLK